MSGLKDSLRDAVLQLAEARDVLQTAASLYAERKADFENKNAGQAMYIIACKKRCDELEAEVRGTALVCYDLDSSNKKLIPGISVSIRKDYAVDAQAALVFAKATGLALIPESVDLAAIEKIASVQKLPFVTVTDNPTVSISKNLRKAIEASADASLPELTPDDL